MSRIAIDESGTVRLWDDNGELVQSVAIDPKTGRSETLPRTRCLHPMLAPGGICRICYRQVIIDPSDQAAHGERLAEDESGGMLIAAVAAVVITVGMVILGWLLLAVRWS